MAIKKTGLLVLWQLFAGAQIVDLLVGHRKTSTIIRISFPQMEFADGRKMFAKSPASWCHLHNQSVNIFE